MGPNALWAVVSKRLNLSAVIKGQVTAGRRWQVRLVVNQASSGVGVGSVVTVARKPAESDPRSLARGAGEADLASPEDPDGRAGRPPLQRQRRQRRQGASISRQRLGGPPAHAALRRTGGAMAASANGEEAAPAEVTEETEESETQVSSAGQSTMLEASLGPRAIFRTLTFADNYSGVPGYRLPGAPGIAGEVSLFPAARTTGLMRNLGLAASLESSLGAQTQNAEGGALPTRYLSYRAGVRARLPFTIGQVLLGADYGEQRFDLDLPEPLFSPKAAYGYLRPSIAGRVELGRFSVLLSAAYLHVTRMSGLTAPERFPNATVTAGDAAAAVGYAFDGGLELQVGADYRRFAYDMNVKEGDALIAGGAVDEYFGVTGLVTYRFR